MKKRKPKKKITTRVDAGTATQSGENKRTSNKKKKWRTVMTERTVDISQANIKDAIAPFLTQLGIVPRDEDIEDISISGLSDPLVPMKIKTSKRELEEDTNE